MNDRIEMFSFLRKKVRPLNVTSYFGAKPDMDEFQSPWMTCVRAHRGQGVISTDATPIHSDGVLGCSVLLIKNEQTRASAGFHIDVTDATLNKRQVGIFMRFMIPALAELKLGRNEDEVRRLLANFKNANGNDAKRLAILTKDAIPPGLFRSRFLYGSESRKHRADTEAMFLKPFQIQVGDDIQADTGSSYWETIYKPENDQILINAELSKKVFEYRL